MLMPCSCQGACQSSNLYWIPQRRSCAMDSHVRHLRMAEKMGVNETRQGSLRVAPNYCAMTESHQRVEKQSM